MLRKSQRPCRRNRLQKDMNVSTARRCSSWLGTSITIWSSTWAWNWHPRMTQANVATVERSLRLILIWRNISDSTLERLHMNVNTVGWSSPLGRTSAGMWSFALQLTILKCLSETCISVCVHKCRWMHFYTCVSVTFSKLAFFLGSSVTLLVWHSIYIYIHNVILKLRLIHVMPVHVCLCHVASQSPSYNRYLLLTKRYFT